MKDVARVENTFKDDALSCPFYLRDRILKYFKSGTLKGYESVKYSVIL